MKIIELIVPFGYLLYQNEVGYNTIACLTSEAVLWINY